VVKGREGEVEVHFVVPRLRKRGVDSVHPDRHSGEIVDFLVLNSGLTGGKQAGHSTIAQDRALGAIQAGIKAGIDELDDTLVCIKWVRVGPPVISLVDDDVHLLDVVTHVEVLSGSPPCVRNKVPVDEKEHNTHHSPATEELELFLQKRNCCQWTE